MIHRTKAYINLNALDYNLQRIKILAPYSKIVAIVKSNAYGHGAIAVAKRIMCNVHMFGVMFIHEALQLRHALIKNPIVIFTGFMNKHELRIIQKYDLITCIHNFEQIDILEKEKTFSKPVKIWLKVDTGMHRLGFQLDQINAISTRLMENPFVQKPFVTYSHFANADNLGSNKTIEQISKFNMIIGNNFGMREFCLANSASIISWQSTHMNWIRPGLMLYGASPFRNYNGLDLGLKPVMTLTSHIIAIHNLNKGDTIGYGDTFKCSQKMRIGIVSIGYGDGYPRNVVHAPLLINGEKTYTIGRVAMDMIAIDLTNIKNTNIGSQVTLWGEGLPVEEVSKHAGEINYELFCRLTSRVKRININT